MGSSVPALFEESNSSRPVDALGSRRPRTIFRGADPSWAGVLGEATRRRTHRSGASRRRAVERRGPGRARGSDSRSGTLASARSCSMPALNPDGLARGAKNSARDVDLNRNLRGPFTGRAGPRARLLPGDGAALRARDARCWPGWSRAHAVRGVVAVHAPFACVNYDGPARLRGRSRSPPRAAGPRAGTSGIPLRGRSAAGSGSTAACPS